MPGYGDLDVVRNLSGITRDDLGLESGTQFTELLENMNERVSALVEQVTSRDFTHHEDETDALDGNGRRALRLPGYPVTEITSVQVNEKTIPTDEWRVRKGSGILERRAQVWPRGWENIQVTYSWGFVSTPFDIKHVVESVMVRLLQRAGKAQVTKGASSISMDGFSTTYGVDFDAQEVLTSMEREALGKYKKVGAV